jgi:hypothetical protein
VTISAADIISPVFSTTEVVTFLASCVARQTYFGDLFWRFVFEGNYLCGIAVLQMRFAWTMAGFAASNLRLPAVYIDEFGVRSMGEGFELILVTIFTGFTPNIFVRGIGGSFGGGWFYILGKSGGRKPHRN